MYSTVSLSFRLRFSRAEPAARRPPDMRYGSGGLCFRGRRARVSDVSTMSTTV